MRTIKFRGKRVDNGEWGYGDLHHGFITGNGYINGREIQPETVGQFTGLFDKGGKEIYEGDIVGVNQFNMEMSFHKVEYDIENKYPAFDLNPIFKFADSNSLQYALIVYEVEVVGNIHDNKDLLE